MESSRFSLETLHGAARMYYLEDATQSEIADRLGVSRPTVSRLLSEARRIGIVRIEVVNPTEAALGELQAELSERLGLRRILIAPGEQSKNIRAGLVRQVSEIISGWGLLPGDVMLVSSGYTMYEIAKGAALPRLPGVVVAPTVGGQAEPEPWHQTNEITRTLAEKTGSHPEFLFAQAMPAQPLYDSLMKDASFLRIREMWRSARGALLGIGAPPLTRGSISRAVPVDDPALLRAVGDVCLNFLDIDGAEVSFPGSERMVRIPLEELRRIPDVVGVAVGEEKVVSINAAIAGGAISSLVTDEPTARSLLRLLDRGRPLAR